MHPPSRPLRPSPSRPLSRRPSRHRRPPSPPPDDSPRWPARWPWSPRAAARALEHARPAAPGHLPTTTLAINVVGALALGLLLGSLGEQRPRLRLALGTGVLGGLTTHSTFILESHRLLASGGAAGRPALGAAYLLGSMAAGLAAAAVGLWLAGRLRRRGPQGGSALQEAS